MIGGPAGEPDVSVFSSETSAPETNRDVGAEGKSRSFCFLLRLLGREEFLILPAGDEQGVLISLGRYAITLVDRAVPTLGFPEFRIGLLIILNFDPLESIPLKF